MIGRTIQGGRLGNIFRLREIRLGLHDAGARTRIAWEMRESADMPLYEVTLRLNSGRSLQPLLRGAAYLDVVLHDVNAMEMESTLPLSMERGIVHGVALLPMEDDAILRFGVDLEKPARFEIFELEDPVRLVIDVFLD